MRLDHIAYRTKDRKKTADFFVKAFGYKIQQEFTIDFGDGQTAQCIALEPPEKKETGVPWVVNYLAPSFAIEQEYHLPPEIFVSDGSPGSIVDEWVKTHGSGVHHIAYMVDSIVETVKEWKDKGYAEFTSEEPMKCPEDNLVQIFTCPSDLTGVIYEFIERGDFGFCGANVKKLMESTKGL